VLAVRAEHQAMVRDYLDTVTDEMLAETRPHPVGARAPGPGPPLPRAGSPTSPPPKPRSRS
jgi:hypothetical protein